MAQTSNADNVPLFAAGIGVSIILVCTALSANSDPTDSDLFWFIGLPLAYLMTFVCGRLDPEHPGRGVVWLFGAMIVTALIIGLLTDGLNLWPLTIVFFAVIALPALVTARLGARFGMGRE